MFGAVGFWSLSVWGSLVFTCCGYVNFIYPSIRDNNLTFNDIDVVYFTWVSSVDEPWMNLWCAPNSSVPQSKDYVYHRQVPTNGSNPQSFPYTDYNQHGICHMQVESFSGDDGADSPVFGITSEASVSPKMWGLDALGAAGGSPNPSIVQKLGAVPSTLLITVTSTSSFPSATPTPSSAAQSPTTTYSQQTEQKLGAVPSTLLTTVTSTSSSPLATTTPSSTAQSPTTTNSQQTEQISGSGGDGGGGGGLGVSNKIAVGIGVPVGLTTMVGTWISWKIYSSRRNYRGYR